jgi:uncharacterized protein YyaL (SSP411 family)
MPNRLIHETSPYLLQHANNPVNWYPYGNEAIEEAKRRNCPIIISIGYSACHWCHVMEHESFSVPEVAEVMNSLFVCVKVDREERPDVDQIYLNAVQLLHGQGGWPLNCFALPDGRPFWGGTYFRPEQWIDILKQLSNMYQNNYEEILTQAERIHSGLKSMGTIATPDVAGSKGISAVEETYKQLALRFDKSLGGTIGAPKFPMPSLWQFVLNYHIISQSPKALAQLRLTLDKMAMGGIYDQIAGGFARYSTDTEWKVPHFEKMLYDNAQLAVLYANAFRATGVIFYLEIFTGILKFIDTELTSPEGAFYAALDADSEGVEGKFYVWKKQEIDELLPEYADLLSRYWGVGKEGHWEADDNILLRPNTDEQFALIEHLSTEELRQLVKMSKKVLLNYRNQRVRPNLDDKIIVSWNALMIKGFVAGALATAEEAWMETALKAARFIDKNIISAEGKITRTWKNGEANINGFLDDYAFTADAFISLYQLTFDEFWLLKAKQLTDYAIKEFSQESSPLFWFVPQTNDDTNINKLSRILETTDGVEPSGNSVMAWVMLAIGNYFEEQEYIDRSESMCNYIRKNMVSDPAYHAQWATVTAAHANGIDLVTITGNEAVDHAIQLNRQYRPFLLLAAAYNKSRIPVFKNKFRSDNSTMIYKCRNHTCEAPVEKVEDLSL